MLSNTLENNFKIGLDLERLDPTAHFQVSQIEFLWERISKWQLIFMSIGFLSLLHVTIHFLSPNSDFLEKQYVKRKQIKSTGGGLKPMSTSFYL